VIVDAVEPASDEPQAPATTVSPNATAARLVTRAVLDNMTDRLLIR